MNTRAWNCGSTPIPLSRTEIRQKSSLNSASTLTRGGTPEATNLRLFEIKFCNT